LLFPSFSPLLILSYGIRFARARSEGERFRAELTRLKPGDSIFPKRYFVADDQLFRFDSRTYALTNQWTGTTMNALAATLAAQFPDAAFTVTPTAPLE
jgi:hypothetical protein